MLTLYDEEEYTFEARVEPYGLDEVSIRYASSDSGVVALTRVPIPGLPLGASQPVGVIRVKMSARRPGTARITLTATAEGFRTATATFPVEVIRPPTGDEDSQRQHLAALYNATDGANWTDSTAWLTPAPLRRLVRRGLRDERERAFHASGAQWQRSLREVAGGAGATHDTDEALPARQ